MKADDSTSKNGGIMGVQWDMTSHNLTSIFWMKNMYWWKPGGQRYVGDHQGTGGLKVVSLWAPEYWPWWWFCWRYKVPLKIGLDISSKNCVQIFYPVLPVFCEDGWFWFETALKSHLIQESRFPQTCFLAEGNPVKPKYWNVLHQVQKTTVPAILNLESTWTQVTETS